MKTLQVILKVLLHFLINLRNYKCYGIFHVKYQDSHYQWQTDCQIATY